MASKIAPPGREGREEKREGGAVPQAEGVPPPSFPQGPVWWRDGAHSEPPRSPAQPLTPKLDFRPRSCALRTCPGHPNPPPLSSQPAFSAGLSLVGLLTLGAVLSAAGTVREAQGLMAGVSSLCSQMPMSPEKNQEGVKSWQAWAPPPHLSD